MDGALLPPRLASLLSLGSCPSVLKVERSPLDRTQQDHGATFQLQRKPLPGMGTRPAPSAGLLPSAAPSQTRGALEGWGRLGRTGGVGAAHSGQTETL